MTGLDLESFLLLIRADLSTWAFLGLAALGLTFLAWSCRGSRRALRKCLVLSLAAHLGLVLYGSTEPAVLWAVNPDRRDATSRVHVREIRVAPLLESVPPSGKESLVLNAATHLADDRKTMTNSPNWDLVAAPLSLEDKALCTDRPDFERRADVEPKFEPHFAGPIALPPITPAGRGHPLETAPLNPLDESSIKQVASAPSPTPLPPIIDEVERTTPPSPTLTEKEARSPRDLILQTDRRLRPQRSVPKEQDRQDLAQCAF